ncbi:MAG: hypothetical protein ABFD75_02690 [Smithella sp.]
MSYATQTTSAKEELTFTLKTPVGDIKDLHLEFSNSSQFDFLDVKCKEFSNINKEHPKDNNGNPDPTKGVVNLSGAKLGKETAVTVTVKIDSNENDFNWGKAYWTIDGGEIGIKLNKNDFKVVPVGDPQNQFTVTNESDDYVTYQNLCYLNDTAEIPSLTPIGSTAGFTPFVSTLTISPHSTSPSYLFDEMIPGNFLYIEGSVFASDALGNPLNSDDVIDFRFGHQSPVPLPGSLILLGSCLGILVGMLKRIHS